MQPQQQQQNYNTKEMLKGACNCAQKQKGKNQKCTKNFSIRKKP
jgi:hypothetical protein